MFYVNNEQVKGIFLNGRNFNYLSYGFGKIIPEDRNVYQLRLNLAYKYLNQYRIEFGTVKDGYDNALVSPRFDKPDSNGIFHTPFTYYYNNNIISTKNVPVLITNGNYALSNALVYNDMNIKGAISYFAENTDFQGHNVNTYVEEFGSSQSYFESTVMSNCSNFHLRSLSSFSKGSQPTLYNCNNFSGWFNFVRGDDGTRYPGFMGFLEDCKDGIFNINCKNMHGGGSSANVTNYYNFSGIRSCNNIKLNIIGSSWQVWPHDHSFSSNCNINTFNVISGFSYMNDCNFNVELPKDSNPEMTSGFTFLNNAENCNYNLQALDSNLFNYRNGIGLVPFFDYLNNCNLNLQVNNTVGFDYSFGSHFRNCNIIFDNIKTSLATTGGWMYLNNCNITGNVVNSAYVDGAFIYGSNNINVQLNFAGSAAVKALHFCNNVNGNLVAGDMTYVYSSNYLNLQVYRSRLCLDNISHGYFRVNNTTFNCHNTNYTEIYSDGGNTSITGLDNCYNLTLSGLTFNLVNRNMWISDVYNSNLRFGTFELNYNTLNVVNSRLFGFPREAKNTYNCIFIPQNLRQVVIANSMIGDWSKLWPYKAGAGIKSIWNIGNCRIDASEWILGGDITYDHTNYMQTNIANYYNGIATVDLTPYNKRTRLYIHCNTLNLGITGMSDTEPLHGFEDACISASNIYGKNDGTDGAYCVTVRSDTRIYCEDFCNATLVPYITSGNPPVILINNYKTSNSNSRDFGCGLTRIGRLNYQGGAPFRPNLNDGACLFINNALLDGADVNNSLLFVGSNVTWAKGANVTNGGLIVNKEIYDSNPYEVWSRMERSHLAWNIWDSGPWSRLSLIDYCTNV